MIKHAAANLTKLRQLPHFNKVTGAVLAVFFSLVGYFIISSRAAVTGFPDWSTVNTIYYNANEDDSHYNNKFMEKAANDLKAQLEPVAKKTFTVTTTAPTVPAIHLRANSGLAEFAGKNNDAFKLTSDNNGIYITGKGPMAAGHGVYALLDKLGYRWMGVHPAWDVKPTSLVALSQLNEVQAPTFVERIIGQPGYHYYTTEGSPYVPADGLKRIDYWRTRNRLHSDTVYPAYHTWTTFAKPSDLAAIDPNSVCRKNGAPHQALPDHPLVIQRATEFGRTHMPDTYNGPRIVASVPISPEDGEHEMWCDEWKNADGSVNTQTITDKVFALTNQVAKTLKAEGRNRMASVLSYSSYGQIPSFPLDSNVFVEVTDYVVGSPWTTRERLKKFKDMGVFTGSYYYFHVDRFWKDRIEPPLKNDFNLYSVKESKDGKVDRYKTEASDTWGAQGRLYWLTSQLLWNANQDVDTLKDDYYAKAFGLAKEPMKRYYHRLDNQPLTDRVWGLSYRDLDAAFKAAANDPAVTERLRHALYHTHLWREWGDNIEPGHTNFSSVEDAKALYNYIWRLKDLHVIAFQYQETTMRGVLKSRYGLSDSQIAALQNATPPSASEAQAWLDQGLSNWTGKTLLDASYIDPYKSAYQPAGSSLPKLGAKGDLGVHNNILIPSSGNEQITVNLAGNSTIDWMKPDGTIVSTQRLTCSSCALAPYTFPATEPGIYTLRFGEGRGINHFFYGENNGWEASGSYEVPGRMSAVHSPRQYGWWSGGSQEQYFYVPAGTPGMVIASTTAKKATTSNSITLTRPDGSTQTFSEAKNLVDWSIPSPAAGVWKVKVVTSTEPGATDNRLWLFGVPPLTSYDAQTLMVTTGAVSPPPPPPANQAPTASITAPTSGSSFSAPASITIAANASDPDGSVTKVEFFQGSTKLGEDTTSPYSFDWTNVPAGSYSLTAKATDNAGATATSSAVSITVSTTTKTGDLNGDGQVNIFDLSILLSNYNTTNAKADINKDGTVNIFDLSILLSNYGK
jgi:hypothetical protein